MNSLSKMLKEVEDLLDKEIALQKNHGQPYWPDWDAVKLYFSSSTQAILKEAIKKCEKEKVEEGQTEPCKDVMEINYQIGLHKGNNNALDLIKDYLTEALK